MDDGSATPETVARWRRDADARSAAIEAMHQGATPPPRWVTSHALALRARIRRGFESVDELLAARAAMLRATGLA